MRWKEEVSHPKERGSVGMDGRKEKENNVEIGKDISLNREWKWNKTVIKKYLIAISVGDYSQKLIDCTCWSLFVTYNF